MIDRRRFLLAAPAAPVAIASPVEDLWGGSVIDIHAHTRSDADANAAHCDGAGISHAVLLTRTNQLAGARAAQAAHPDRFVWSASTNVTEPNAVDILTKAVEDGAIAFGELKNAVQADGPELQMSCSSARFSEYASEGASGRERVKPSCFPSGEKLMLETIPKGSFNCRRLPSSQR